MCLFSVFFFFFFNDTATTEIYTLSLHDALPIWLLAHADRHVARVDVRLAARYRSSADPGDRPAQCADDDGADAVAGGHCGDGECPAARGRSPADEEYVGGGLIELSSRPDRALLGGSGDSRNTGR